MRRLTLVSLLALAAITASPALATDDVPSTGVPLQFVGRFVGEFLEDGRKVRLLENYTYVDPNGETWPVPVDTVVDGASIPQLFWTLIGGPFEGKYRNASVVHDYYCDQKTRPWEKVHRMFYDAMVESGVEPLQAKIMYYAVYNFGPRWERLNTSVVSLDCPAEGEAGACTPVLKTQSTLIDLPPATYDAEAVEADIRAILETNPSLETIEAMAPGT